MNERKRRKRNEVGVLEKKGKKTFKEEGQSIHINAGNIISCA
jgi:hypothetical protein